MSKSRLLIGAAIGSCLFIGLGPSAKAQVYDNLNTGASVADCGFSTACAAATGRGDAFAAQLFTLTSVKKITVGDFSELDNGFGQSPSSVNWAFYADVGGLPGGPALASGSSKAYNTGGFGLINGFEVAQEDFSVTPLVLHPGSYFFAIQAVSSYADTYLQQGLAASGAAESHDGGATWTAGYETGVGGSELGGLSVALYNSVPEPAAWAIMLVGFCGVGVSLRSLKRRRLYRVAAPATA